MLVCGVRRPHDDCCWGLLKQQECICACENETSCWSACMPFVFVYFWCGQARILPSLFCDAVRCVCVFKRCSSMIHSSLMTLCVPLTHTRTHKHSNIIQRIPTHTMMTPWTGATPSLRVCLPFSPRWTLQYLTMLAWYHVFLEAGCANGPLYAAHDGNK